jgi:hypothetical protein
MHNTETIKPQFTGQIMPANFKAVQNAPISIPPTQHICQASSYI